MSPQHDHRPVVVLTHRAHPDVVDLLARSCHVIPNHDEDSLPAHELRHRTRSAEAMMMFMPDRIDDEFLGYCPRLQIIAGALKGYDNVDVDACTRRGIWFTHVDDLLTEPTAELAVGLLIGLGRHITAGDHRVRNGCPGWRPVLYGRSLIRSTIGIIGAGPLGQAVARLLAGFDARLVYSDPQPVAKQRAIALAIERLPLAELLAASDSVIVCVPLLPSTTHLLDHAALQSMRRGSLLVNVGRGSVVDEAAVADALRTGQLGSYAADVFEFEDWARPDRPRCIHPALRQLPTTTLFTPHLGSAVAATRHAIETRAAESILQAFAGQSPDGAVNRPEQPPILASASPI